MALKVVGRGLRGGLRGGLRSIAVDGGSEVWLRRVVCRCGLAGWFGAVAGHDARAV